MTPILVQFVFRLTFGMALAMAATPSSLVTSGFYRVHLWVLMGLNTFATLALLNEPLGASPSWTLAMAVAAGVLSYVGAVLWLYEARRPGAVALAVIAACGLGGALLATEWSRAAAWWGPLGDVLSSGLLMGGVMTAMLLGHWYLNTPSMQLFPLERLVRWSGAATVLRGVVCGAGLAMLMLAAQRPATGAMFWTFVGFRWIAGLVVVGVLIVLTRQTLRVPNTQSATGILYATIVLVFLGELVGQLLSADSPYPL